MTHNTKIIVGISGGVDSAVSAYLLKQQGYDVEGLFMKNWEDDDGDGTCSAEIDYADAKAVCSRIKIPLHQVNFAKHYWDRVFSHFLSEYQAGRTPNPDVLCNKEIKFRAFLDYALKQGADFIATGHYARTMDRKLFKGLDVNKDQTYFLYLLDKEQLSKVIFPLGEYNKTMVRQIAKEQGFPNYDKKDSTGICFIGEKKFKDFLNEYLLAQPGIIKTIDGEEIGRHDGLMFHTIGQRAGLGIGGLKNKSDEPWYVVDKDIQNNILLVTQGNNHPSLFSAKLICTDMHWISGDSNDELSCQAKIRYRQEDQPCTIKKLDQKNYQIDFDQPQRAITPGQSIVFYQNEECLGGGIIT